MAPMPISTARRRADIAKRTLAAASVLAFVVTIGLARSSHPAKAAASGSGAPATDSSQTSFDDQGFGQADIGPAPESQVPSVSTGAS